MNPHNRLYLYGALLLVFGGYQLFLSHRWECALYGMAGVCFFVNGFTSEPFFSNYRKPMVVFSWVSIMATAVLFLYILQFKTLGFNPFK